VQMTVHTYVVVKCEVSSRGVVAWTMFEASAVEDDDHGEYADRDSGH